jgi:hypothetical protein
MMERMRTVRVSVTLTGSIVMTVQVVATKVVKVVRDVEGEGAFEGGTSTAAAALERTTVLLSCYGIGYSNVYRRVT